MPESEDKLNLGPLFISLVVGYSGVKIILGNASFLATLPSGHLGGLVFSALTSLIGVGLILLGYGIYKEFKWSMYLGLGWFGLMLISDLMLLGTSDLSVPSLVTHALIVSYLIYFRSKFKD